MNALGDTALWDALALANDQLSEYGRKFPNAKKRIICLSDGNDTKSKQRSSDVSWSLFVSAEPFKHSREFTEQKSSLIITSKTRLSLIRSASDVRITLIFEPSHTYQAVISSSHNLWSKQWQFAKWNLFSVSLSDLQLPLHGRLIITTMTRSC
jgi:hypothetical protein